MPFLVVVTSAAVAVLAVVFRQSSGKIIENVAYECSSNGKDFKCCGFGAAISHIATCALNGDKCCRGGDDERHTLNCCVGNIASPDDCIMKQSAEERKKRCINVRVENKGALIVKAETANDWDVKCSGKTNSKDCHPWGRLHAGQSCDMVMVRGGTLRIDVVDDGRRPFEFQIPQSTKMVIKGHIHGPTFNCEAASG